MAYIFIIFLLEVPPMEYCHVLYPKNPSVVKIIQWIQPTKWIDHFFVGNQLPSNIQYELMKMEKQKSYDKTILIETFSEKIVDQFTASSNPHFVYESIFIDDPLTTTLAKIIIFLKIETSLIPYVWTENPLRFKINNLKWDGYDVHPFKSNGQPEQMSDTQFLGETLTMDETINIIFHENFKKYFRETNFESYYFPNKKDVLGLNKKNIKGYLNDQSLLYKLWYQEPAKHEDMIQKSICTINRARFKSSLSDQESLKSIFNTLHTTDLICFIQFINDMNHVYYKVLKEHRIPVILFDQWTNMDLSNGQTQLILYSFLQENSSLYAEIRIDHLFNIFISYKLDFSENITFEIIEKHIEKIAVYFRKYLNITSLEFEIETLSLRTNVLVSQANLKSLSKYFATLLPLYNIPSKNRISKNIMDLQFKRIPKFGQTKNIREYIKSQLSLDIPILDILLDLQEYGLDEAEVREYLEEIQTEQEKIVERRKKDIRNIGLIMHLSIVSFGIQINIDNASSMFDIHNALAWTRAAILAWRTETPIEKTKVALVSEEKVEEEEKIVVTIPSRLSSVSSTGSELSIGSEDEFMGGAIGKEYNRYFNNLLKQLDPTIFTLTENYARKCQVADFRQPIGISKKQKEFIDSSIYKDGYDNSIEYGSDPNKTNIYICPRVWCPKSQVPLSPELYEKNQGKCPREDEEPMLLYKHATWYNDINRPHYVGFLKERGFNNVKLPCCFKKQQTIMNTSVKEKEGDSYIIDRVKNIQESRFGTIPLALHEFLYPNVPYQLCRNTVKTDECLLRRGIATSKDSFLTSIAYLMNFDSKSDLVKHIQKELTPEVFISLENGLVYQTFQSENTLFIEKDLKLRQQLHDWLLSYPKYLQLYDLNDILSLLQKDSIDDLPLNVRYKMARQLSIMDSYLQFMNYIQEDNEKNPHMFFDLFHHLGFLIIVWNRDASSIATLKCPFASKLKQWLMGSHKLLPCLLLMSFESSYEPLILVDPSKNITQKIMFTKYAKLESFLLQCPTFHTNEDIWIQKLYSLEQWTEHMLINPNAFKINRIILDYNYRICAFVTKGLLWIDIPEHLSIGSISYIMNALPIQHISYWEDIESTLWDIQCNHQDYALWRLKLKSFDFGTKSGEVRQVNYRLHMLFKVPKVVYPDLPKVPIVLQDVFINRLDTIESDNSEWFTTKKYILSKLISKYDSWVKPLLKVATKERLDKLYEHFEHLQQIARVTVLLEELPIDNLEQLKKIYQDLLLDKPYYHIPENLYEGYRNKEWIFTQHTLSAKDMTFVKQPSISYNIDIFPKENQETLQQVSTKVATPPDMMIESKCDVIHLPTKWRAAVWKEYTIYILKSYTKTSLLDLLQWLAEQTYQYWDVRDLQMYIKKQYFDLLENREQYPKLFEDPSMRLAWNNILQRQYRNVNELIQNGLAPLSIEEIQQKWIDVLSSQQDTLWIQDLDLYHLSRLFKLSFLVIIKGKSTTKKEDDITSSVKYICGFQYSEWKYRPMLTLYKQLSDDKSHYIYGLMKKNKKSFYRQAIEAPEELLEIIEHIIQK